MKSSSVNTALQGALAASLVLSIFLGVRFYFRTHEARSFNAQIIQYQQNRAYMQLLLNEAVEYSKRNTAILPVLDSIGIPRPGVPATNKPANK